MVSVCALNNELKLVDPHSYCLIKMVPTNFSNKSPQEAITKSSHNRSRVMKRKAGPNAADTASKKKLRIDQAQNCGATQNTRKDDYLALQQPYAVSHTGRKPLETGHQDVSNNTTSSPRRRLDGPDDGFAEQKAHPATAFPDLIVPIKEKTQTIPAEDSLQLSDARIARRKPTTSSPQWNGNTLKQSSPKKSEAAKASEQNMWQATTMKGISKAFPTYKDSGSALYGDLVQVLAGLGVVPVRCYDLYQVEVDDPDRLLCAFSIALLIFAVLMALFAVHWKNVWFSRMSVFGMSGLCYVSNVLVDWPHPGECTATAIFHAGMLFFVMANLSLRFEEKMVRLLILFIVCSSASIQSPYSVYLEDTLPLIGGTALISIVILYVCHFGFVSSVQAARLILGGLLVRQAFISATAPDETFSEHTLSIVRGAFLTFVGIAAAGTFEDEMLQKERLEKLVQTRTQSLHMVNLALQASETAIAITENSGCIIWVNSAFERLSGKNEESLLGVCLKNIIYSLDSSRKENKYLLMESYDNPSEVIERDFKIGKSVFHLEATPFSSESYRKDAPVQNDQFLMVFKDITATRERDVAEKKAQQEAMLAKAMGESMVTLTHELRTPLQGIMGVTSLLLQQAGDLTKDATDSLKLIMASSTLLLNLINNLLDVKKENAKKMENFPLSPISASEQIQDAVAFCQPLAFISNVKLVTDIRTDVNPIVNSNALRLQQVLINLVSNAIKYTRRESEIRIRIRSTSLGEAKIIMSKALAASHNANQINDEKTPVLIFSVSDFGSGIAPDQASRLFEQYVQLKSRPMRTLGSNAVGQPSGTGVGLHLCRLFVNRMNGQIWATNNGGGSDGSTFSFYLPLVSGDASISVLDVPRSNKAPDFRKKSSTHNLGIRDKKEDKKSPVLDYRVLFVDDILINRKVIGRMIKKVGISKSTTVDSGENALEELARNHYDLVITDLQMPGMSGTELSAAIRDNKTSSSTPIVVGLTASGDDATRCVESGMADLLYKPITVSEMKEYFETIVPNLKPGVWYKSMADFNTAPWTVPR